MLVSAKAGALPKGFHAGDLLEAIRQMHARVRLHDTPAARRSAAIKKQKPKSK
jgi:hypothetical protein